MTERINIHEPIAEICKRLGLKPELVSQINIRHSDLIASVFVLDDNGDKHLEDGVPHVETRMFKVTA